MAHFQMFFIWPTRKILQTLIEWNIEKINKVCVVWYAMDHPEALEHLFIFYKNPLWYIF